MAQSSIEWTESTWNPLTGCTKISPGCKLCYAERMARRLHGMGLERYKNGFELTMHEDILDQPFSWKKPQVVFVNSMSDMFHDDVPIPFIKKTFDVMDRAFLHQFQILTKRSERLMILSPELNWPANVWMGVSVENADYTFRISHLKRTRAAVKFLSLEPLLGPLPNLDLKGIDWVIVGGESGPGARPVDPSWVLDIKSQCTRSDVPFFFKQWGGFNKKKAGRLLEGRTWDEMPKAV
ncbi:MAG: phage Gp37/Gp68 family protein [Deltaproteobacteria bacterium]|nr:phage Gp37/Gp68 family protein [Deltaproteobacteria bacterium]